MKKNLLLLLTIILSSFLVSKAVNVTVQLDLNNINDKFDGGAVWVYMDADWAEYYYMEATDSDGIYSFTLEKEAGSVFTYSFSYQTGADEWNDYTTENVPEDCANESGFRQIVVPTDDVTLDPVFYGSCTNDAQPSKVKVTFSVNMSNETVLNNNVQVVIKNPWIWTALSDQGNGIWSATIELDPNKTYPYTFVNGGKDNWSGEEKVASECNFGSESAPERQLVVEESDLVLALVNFGQCANETAVANVNVQVDMNNVTDLFEGGAVWVYMDADWAEYYYMEDTDGDGIYSYTLEKEAGSVFTYSFSYQTGADEWSDYTTENLPKECANADGFREITLKVGENVLEAVAYGSCTISAPSKVKITFQVNMKNETVLKNDVQVVIKNPWIWTPLVDKGDGVWSATVEVDANNTYPYTFVNGGKDNWSGEEKIEGDCNYGSSSAPERQVSVATSDLTLDLVSFGSCTLETGLDNVNDRKFEVYPNPVTDLLKIKSYNEKINSVEIYSVSGKRIYCNYELNNNETQLQLNDYENGFYVLVINKNKFSKIVKN